MYYKRELIICILAVLLIGGYAIHQELRPINIVKEIRSYGFDGAIEVYHGELPYSQSTDGIYNFTKNTIAINDTLSKDRLLWVIRHELKHWYCDEEDEDIVDDCVLRKN